MHYGEAQSPPVPDVLIDAVSTLAFRNEHYQREARPLRGLLRQRSNSCDYALPPSLSVADGNGDRLFRDSSVLPQAFDSAIDWPTR
jgi:hypothetical protein